MGGSKEKTGWDAWDVIVYNRCLQSLASIDGEKICKGFVGIHNGGCNMNKKRLPKSQRLRKSVLDKTVCRCAESDYPVTATLLLAAT